MVSCTRVERITSWEKVGLVSTTLRDKTRRGKDFLRDGCALVCVLVDGQAAERDVYPAFT